MAATLQNKNYDPLEYVENMKKLGGDEKMATYQARYTEEYVHQTIKEYIADLHLEQFATKQDLTHAISELKYSLLLWIITISVAGFSTTIGVTYFMMKFMLESVLHIKL